MVLKVDETGESAHNLAISETTNCLPGARIKRKPNRYRSIIVMQFLLADEVSIPAQIASNGLSSGHWPETLQRSPFFTTC